MDLNQTETVVRAYYASVSFVDSMVGKILDAVEETDSEMRPSSLYKCSWIPPRGTRPRQKVSIHEESVKVPLIISVPGKPVVCHSLTELIDLILQSPSCAD